MDTTRRPNSSFRRLLTRPLRRFGLAAGLLLATVAGCSTKDTEGSDGGPPFTGPETAGSGGVQAPGGSSSAGAAASTAGTAAASGGVASGGVSSGGASTTTGGTGGASAGGAGGSAGAPTTGGAGGAGGSWATGGTDGSGGASATGGTSGTGGVESGTVDAIAMAQDMGFGTNIGNTLENTTAWETGWGQPVISEAYIDGIARRGIRTVRVPVAWDTYASAGVIDAEKMNRVKEVVGWIAVAGMYSIVNIHWDGGWLFNEGTADEYRLTENVRTQFVSYWRQIATAFADVGHNVVFEGLNEEARYYVNGDSNGQPDYAALNEVNQLFVSTVRAEAGYSKTRALLIAGFHTDIELTCVDAFTVPNDPAGPGKLFLSLHYYTPYTFTLMDNVESWGSPSTTWGNDAERAELTRLFDQAGSFSEARGIPIILGEFAVTKGESFVRERESRIRWMESVAQAAFSRGMVPVLWDTGSEISRTDGSFSSEFQEVMNRVGANGSAVLPPG